MHRFLTLLLVLATVAPAPIAAQPGTAPSAAAPPPIAAGRWDVISTGVELAIPGVPGFMQRMMRGKSQTERKCVTPAQAQAGIPALLAPKPEAKCRVERALAADGRIDNVMICTKKEGQPMRVARVGTYTPAGYRVRVTMTGTTPKGPLRIVADQVATHAGARCK